MSYFYVIWLQDMLVRKRLRRGQHFKFSWTLNMHICNVKPFALKRDLLPNFIPSIKIHYNYRHCWNSSTEYRNLYALFYLWHCSAFKGYMQSIYYQIHFICLIFTWNMTGKIGQFGILTNYLLIIQPCRFYTIYSAVMGNARFCLQLMIIADND